MFYERKISQSMCEHATMSCELSIKSVDEVGVFVGYGSVFDVVDAQRDVVMRGAFAETLAFTRPEDIKLLWQHDTAEPIGVIEQLYEDTHGLFMRGRLLLDVTRARDAYALLKSGAITGLSIGYSPVRYVMNPDTRVREIKSLKLWEISLVTFPSNPEAKVTVVKTAHSNAYDETSPEFIQAADRLLRLIQEATALSQ